ncbi:MAG TPA: GNAT family N-acetyltransferase [Planctomycetaceae bacterium]|jgi:GNAT superfamily N-acetyltransferase|nr:GNAT family N-acetyltransferase [Planctomycetaceae bacterium]
MPESSRPQPKSDVQPNEPREFARRGSYFISTDRALLDVSLIHAFLSEQSYWAPGIPREVVERSLDNSLCFGVYDEGRQVGFARVVTDRSTFAWLADVFVIDAHRGRGLGKWLIESLLTHPDLQGLRRILLGTRDAHGLYAQYGFKPLTDPTRFQEIHRSNVYLDGPSSR